MILPFDIDIPAEEPNALGMDLGGIREYEVMARGRNIQRIDDDIVTLWHHRIVASGVVEQIHTWQREDGAGEGVGGRPAMIPVRALLTALSLMAYESSPMHITRAALLLQYRLSPASRALLGVPTPLNAFAAHNATNRRWYDNTMRAFQRLNGTLDPYPHQRYTQKSYAEVEEIHHNHDSEREAVCRARLNRFNALLLKMTWDLQPRAMRRAQAKLDVSFDQTFIATPTPKGYSLNNLARKVKEEAAAGGLGTQTPGPVDVFAAFKAKTERGNFRAGEIDTVGPGKKKGDDTEYSWGWVANIAVRVNSEKPRKKQFPSLVVAWNLSLPNREVSEEAVQLLRNAAELGITPGVADADKEYWANAVPSRLLRPGLATGFTPSTDYRTDRLGVQGGQHGALFVEGHAYCPRTPQHLINATVDNHAGTIDIETYRLRLNERAPYRLHVKERKPNGKVMLRCPALGPSATVDCPLRAFLDSHGPKSRPATPRADKERPYVELAEDFDEEFIDDICRKHSASFDLTQMKSPEQAFDFGSPEWEAFHQHARNSVESVNEQLKASGNADIATAARRRVRGFSAASIMLSILIVNHNIRRIASYLSDQVKERVRGTPPGPSTPRRRDRVWANRYTKTTGNGDLSFPHRGASQNPDAPPGTPQRT